MLGRFFDRVADAVLPLLGPTTRGALEETLNSTVLEIELVEATQQQGFLFAVNLAARIYPSLSLRGDSDIVEEAKRLATSINPVISFDDAATVRLAFDREIGGVSDVHVFASGWNVSVDGFAREKVLEDPAGPAQFGAACVGMAAVFRAVFSGALRRPRTGAETAGFNLVSLNQWDEGLPDRAPEFGRLHLAGAGAIGEAVIAVLGTTQATGELVVVDRENVDLSNLQRYLLTTDGDVGAPKTDLAVRHLEGSGLRVEPVPTQWGSTAASGPGQETVLVALDSWQARIEVQSGLHRRLYNAYTQPADLGWSRHEKFGVEPCLGCMYWPADQRPHRYELIARGLNQHPARVRRYLSERIPVGEPLSAFAPLANETLDPQLAEPWLTTPILEDLAQQFDLSGTDWRHHPLDDFYTGAICAGAAIRIGASQSLVTVPLAHQSAFAGLMLAMQVLVASDEELRRCRPQLIEGRFDMMKPVPTSFSVPSERPASCVCGDEDYVQAYRNRWDPGAGR